MNQECKRDKSAWMLGSLLIALITVISLSACDPAFGFNVQGYAVLEQDLELAWKHTASYSFMDDTLGYWKSPHEFERDGGGDCEDFVTDLMYYLGSESSMYVVKLNGHTKTHAIVWYNGKFIEPQVYHFFYKPSDFTIEYSYSYYEAMRQTTLFGLKNVSSGNRGAADEPGSK